MKIISLEKTCETCPSQWEFQLEDTRYGYARYRWGNLTISLSLIGGTLREAILGETILTAQLCDDLDGFLSTENFYLALKLLGFEYEY